MIDAADTTTIQPGTRIDVRQITQDQLQQLGVSQLAYVKPVMLNGAPMFAIHAADGSPMAVAEDRNLALAAIVQHEMIPTLVH
jgi:hypothetical protein